MRRSLLQLFFSLFPHVTSWSTDQSADQLSVVSSELRSQHQRFFNSRKQDEKRGHAPSGVTAHLIGGGADRSADLDQSSKRCFVPSAPESDFNLINHCIDPIIDQFFVTALIEMLILTWMWPVIDQFIFIRRSSINYNLDQSIIDLMCKRQNRGWKCSRLKLRRFIVLIDYWRVADTCSADWLIDYLSNDHSALNL